MEKLTFCKFYLMNLQNLKTALDFSRTMLYNVFYRIMKEMNRYEKQSG